MITPLYSRLKDYCSVSSRFHTPGHNGVNIDDALYSCANMDITELSFSDNLACPEDIIAQAEDLMSKEYNCTHTLFLANGGSGAVFIALAIMANYGNKIIVSENAHISIFRSVKVLGLEVITVKNKDIISKCENEQGVCAVIMTIPDYYGRIAEWEQIRNYLKKRGILFAIDHSHGMHYIYSDRLPQSLANKADIIIGSLHKTLPVMTGGAVLIINREDLYNLALYHRMNLHSTSPSYLILASIDFARGYMAKEGQKLYDSLYKRVDMIQDELQGSRYSVKNFDDYTRLVIDCGGMSGYSVSKELEKYGIFAEMADNNKIVFILTPFNADKVTRLITQLRKIEVKDEPLNMPHYEAKGNMYYLGKAIEFVPIERSLGRVVMSEIAIYPPSVSLLRSGDIIDQKAIEIILENRKYIIGLVKGLVPVIK